MNNKGTNMEKLTSRQESLQTYYVWGKSIRVFHWVNVICVTGLVFVGLAIFYNKNLGVSQDGKILLKTIHVYIGYTFAVNLFWRIVYLFSSNKYSNWKAILPFGRKHRESLKFFIKETKQGNSANYLGHNPIARMVVALLFLLLCVQAITGLVLAGTDLYYPPFGHKIAEWVAITDESSNKIMNVSPGSKENINPETYKEMRAFRKPFITVHVYTF
jgi:Ni,Fe-hydrogenase I cytochrome b subunit